MQYEKNKFVSLLSYSIPIKYLFDGTKVLRSLIATSFKEGGFYDAWKFFAHQFENGSSHIQGIDFDQSCSPVAHYGALRINIYIEDMYWLAARILDVSNAFQNKNIPIHERVCVSPPPYYLDYFETSYPNIPLNQGDSPFLIQCMNLIQGGKQWDDNGIESLMQ